MTCANGCFPLFAFALMEGGKLSKAIRGTKKDAKKRKGVACQRNGNYEKWKYFDMCLANAINRLSRHEMFSYPLFSGLEKVLFKENEVREGYFATYLSASKSRDVAITFRGNSGTLIEFEKDIKNCKMGYGAMQMDMNSTNAICCDVSWISKFPEEMIVSFLSSFFCQKWKREKCPHFFSTFKK